MKRLKRIVSLTMCVVLLLCMFVLDTSAVSISDTTRVMSSWVFIYEMKATLTLTSTNVLAETLYGYIADKHVINLNLGVHNTSTDTKSTRIYLDNDETCNYLGLSVNAGTNETFYYANSYHQVITTLATGLLELELRQ